MSIPVVTGALRPLSVGELLDRAVSIGVRRFWLFAGIWLPYYSVTFPLVTFLQQRNVHQQAEQDAIRLCSVLFILFVLPLPLAALTWATNESLLGGTPDFTAVYRVAFRRWPALIGLNALFALAGGALFFVILLALLRIVSALLGSQASGLPDAIAFVPPCILVLGICMTYVVSSAACVIDGLGPVAALRIGIRRTWTKIGLLRMLAATGIYAAMQITLSVAVAFITLAATALTRDPILGGVLSFLVLTAGTGFEFALLTLFYLDLCVRQDGVDLQVAANTSASATPSA